LQRWPWAKSMARVRNRVRELTGSWRGGVKDVQILIRDLNPVLRGWGNYFRTGNANDKFTEIDGYVRDRLARFYKRRAGRNLRARHVAAWTHRRFEELGLHRLCGTVRYPGVVHAAS